MTIKSEQWIRIRTIKSSDYLTEVDVHCEQVWKAVYLTSDLVIRNIQLDRFEAILISKWSILWSILRWILKEVNQERTIPLDENKLINLINKLENNNELSLEEKSTLNTLFNDYIYINWLKDMLENHIEYENIIWDQTYKLEFDYMKQIISWLIK
jgi:hypothetical protein